MNQSSDMNNFYFPFEGGRHHGTIIELPYRADTWRNKAKEARPVFLELVKIISKYEMVYLLCDPQIDEEELKPFRLANVEILRIPYNDSWARDNTLIFLFNHKKLKALDFGFNAWGGHVDGLYQNWSDDDKLGQRLIDYFKCDSISAKDFILEGGSVHSDGEGTILTTEACLLSKGRNSNLTKEEIEKKLLSYFNAKKVIWLPHGIYNDETNEHVDNVACFLEPGVVALASSDDLNDIQSKYYKEALDVLNHERDAKGRSLKIVNINVPSTLYLTKEEAQGLQITDAIIRPENNRLAGSYINFYMSDKFVIVPQFGVPEDQNALNILKEYYPNKDVYSIMSREILLAGGNIHCVTMQIPGKEE